MRGTSRTVPGNLFLATRRADCSCFSVVWRVLWHLLFSPKARMIVSTAEVQTALWRSDSACRKVAPGKLSICKSGSVKGANLLTLESPKMTCRFLMQRLQSLSLLEVTTCLVGLLTGVEGKRDFCGREAPCSSSGVPGITIGESDWKDATGEAFPEHPAAEVRARGVTAGVADGPNGRGECGCEVPGSSGCEEMAVVEGGGACTSTDSVVREEVVGITVPAVLPAGVKVGRAEAEVAAGPDVELVVVPVVTINGAGVMSGESSDAAGLNRRV